MAPKIQRMHTIIREAIAARVKLEIILDFLPSGISYRKLSYSYRVSRSSISKFVPEVYIQIYKVLKENIKVCIYFIFLLSLYYILLNVIIIGFSERSKFISLIGFS